MSCRFVLAGRAAGGMEPDMTIWKNGFPIDLANQIGADCANGHLGIEILEAGDDYLKGRMPVDRRTKQPFGVLHGGASILFAETLGSVAAAFAAGVDDCICVGQEINGNHVRAARSGWVYGIARPFHLGGKSHVWGVEITDEDGRLVCVARLTVAILPKP